LSHTSIFSDPPTSGARAEWLEDTQESLKKEHKLLGQVERRLSTALSDGNSTSISDSFERVLSFMSLHFATEDRLMILTHYSGFAVHKGEHEEALGNIRRLEQKFLAGNSAAGQELLMFIKQWRSKHQTGADKRLAQHFARWAGKPVRAARQERAAEHEAEPSAATATHKSASA
jgi:hemerythrin